MKANLIYLPFLAISCITTAQAHLYDRGNGMIYDDVLDVTWLKDANYANTLGYVTSAGRDVTLTGGQMTWDEAMEWAEQLSFAGFNQWRLPDVKPVNGVSFQINVSFDGSTDFGERITSPKSELSYMYFANLNNTSVHDILGNFVGCGPGALSSCLTNTGPFDNFESYNYWFGVEVEAQYNPTGIFAWSFNSQHGIQTLFDGKPNEFYAWAVHEGDIAAVPLPSTFWLFGSIMLFLTNTKKILDRTKFSK